MATLQDKIIKNWLTSLLGGVFIGLAIYTYRHIELQAMLAKELPGLFDLGFPLFSVLLMIAGFVFLGIEDKMLTFWKSKSGNASFGSRKPTQKATDYDDF